MYFKDDELKQVGTYDRADNMQKSDVPKAEAKFASFDATSTEVIENKDT